MVSFKQSLSQPENLPTVKLLTFYSSQALLVLGLVRFILAHLDLKEAQGSLALKAILAHLAVQEALVLKEFKEVKDLKEARAPQVSSGTNRTPGQPRTDN